MGVPGPGGPCSEIYYDRGSEHGREGGPIADEDRYLEVWNLVFMQYQLSTVRTKVDFDIAGPLPAQNIDTGMGLERMATVLQGVDNLYEIDTSRAILDRAAQLTGARYGAAVPDDVRLRVVADHARTAVMLIGDGVVPGNDGRGYVLRRILRRTVRSMRLLGAGDPVMSSLVEASIGAMGPQYPELVEAAGRITTVAVAEEGSFLETLTKGATVFDQAVPAAKAAGGVLSGSAAFSLHDTYGFPIDLTLEMAAEQGLSVDEDGFRALMKEQRERGKADAKGRKTGGADTSAYRSLLEGAGSTTFTGYAEVASEAVVRGLLVDGAVASAAPEGSTVEVVLDRSPFYAEAGGQLADAGRLVLSDGTELLVGDVQHALPGLTVHKATVVRGEARVGTSVLAEVDVERRRAISRAHTATHLVHTAFRAALGEQATQAGSENRPGRFRFDFASPSRRTGIGVGRRRAGDQRGGAGRPRGPRVRHDARTRRAGSARWRCSARSTATRSASSRSATTPASCAAARTPRARVSSAWSSCSASPPSGPACAASRGSSGWTPSRTSRASTCCSRSSPPT